MKLITLAIAIAQSSLGFRQETFGLKSSCPVLEGCTMKKFDTCCVSKMGIILYSLQWVDATGPADKFTVHGFWPDRCDGTQAPRSGCDSSRHYHNLVDHLSSLNSTLVEQMQKNWPSYTGNNPSFWTHEWNKHGTCVSTLEPQCYSEYKKYEDAHDFFVIVMDLYRKYDYAASLKKAGIVPGRSYRRDSIIKAIQDDTGLHVALTCRGRNLREVRTWFQAVGRDGLKPIASQGHSSCPVTINFQKKAHMRKLSTPALGKELVLQNTEAKYSLQTSM
ncbi:hypothetical protein DSO57_1025788 [Entomophthora muscae]|uniref:Uncharacterized protein n=1 Tax=Entomophthora muscae TaxID=34485 RepID=A0ACC2SF69_9FUNG|nr:hypothetical protein DSO57_1025788 [Entomophthora muscae]